MSFAEKFLNRNILLELAPTAVFFIVNFGWGLMPATAAVMAATLVAVIVGLTLNGRVPVIAVAALVIVLILGGTGLLLNDDFFIKIKPTVGNSLFALALIVGLFFQPSFLVRALGDQLKMTSSGWQTLTACWIGFSLCLAGLNEIVWRTQETDTWVAFKTGLSPGALLGYVIITNVVARRYWDEDQEEAQAS